MIYLSFIIFSIIIIFYLLFTIYIFVQNSDKDSDLNKRLILIEDGLKKIEGYNDSDLKDIKENLTLIKKFRENQIKYNDEQLNINNDLYEKNDGQITKNETQDVSINFFYEKNNVYEKEINDLKTNDSNRDEEIHDLKTSSYKNYNDIQNLISSDYKQNIDIRDLKLNNDTINSTIKYSPFLNPNPQRATSTELEIFFMQSHDNLNFGIISDPIKQLEKIKTLKNYMKNVNIFFINNMLIDSNLYTKTGENVLEIADTKVDNIYSAIIYDINIPYYEKYNTYSLNTDVYKSTNLPGYFTNTKYPVYVCIFVYISKIFNSGCSIIFMTYSKKYTETPLYNDFFSAQVFKQINDFISKTNSDITNETSISINTFCLLTNFGKSFWPGIETNTNLNLKGNSMFLQNNDYNYPYYYDLDLFYKYGGSSSQVDSAPVVSKFFVQGNFVMSS